MGKLDYRTFFAAACGSGQVPYPYQERLACGEPFPELLDVPTGLGKTAAAVLAWLWRRRFHCDQAIRDSTPRRLVYCLPMRVLVEQTHASVIRWLTNLDLVACAIDRRDREGACCPARYTPDPADNTPITGWAAGAINDEPSTSMARIAVHLLMGGEETTDWALWPERDAILIGTQDMLLSRALNRGYAAGRARWPLEFGFLNSDCLWVFDEIQIMDSGLATSLQFDAWRRSLRLRPARDQFPKGTAGHISRPCRSLWMSATMARHWLERAVDFAANDGVKNAWENRRLQLGRNALCNGTIATDQASPLVQGLFSNRKTLEKPPVATLPVPRGKDSRPDEKYYLDNLSQAILSRQAPNGLTLVIVNTVDRAVGTFSRLRKRAPDIDAFLIHSRFRPIEREQWAPFLRRQDDRPRIIVSTQVVEAGVDLSAKVLFTELAPWASLVQRFGRCARFASLDNEGSLRSEHGLVYWMDLVHDERATLPYGAAELSEARSLLERPDIRDVGLQTLSALQLTLADRAQKLFPYEPRFVPRDKDLFDLFDTTPDLTGADVDISRYIRDGEELDVQVFWRDIDGEPAKKVRPDRRELCPVPFRRFREFAHSALKQRRRIWRRCYVKGRNRTSTWERLNLGEVEQAVYPGQVFLLESGCGGYSPTLGWTGQPEDAGFESLTPVELAKPAAQDNDDNTDDLSEISGWLTVLEHSRDVCLKLEELLPAAELTDSEIKVLRLAGRWHDRGKAHAAFQAKLKADLFTSASAQAHLAGQPAAKAPDGKDPKTGKVDNASNAWRKDKLKPNTPGDLRRPGFRHELASALAILETLHAAQPEHQAFAWPDGLDKERFDLKPSAPREAVAAGDLLARELAALSLDELDLLIYLVAAHHGKVRMSLRSSPDDGREDVPDLCPRDKRQARGVRDDDLLLECEIPAANLSALGVVAPRVKLWLDPMEIGLSRCFGASWRERMQLLVERLGPFRVGYLEAVLRAADCRASIEEDERGGAVSQPRKGGE